MASVRAIVEHDGNHAEYETFKIDNDTITYVSTEERGSASRDLAVTMSADDTVKLTEDAERVVGKLISVSDDNMARVQVGGYMTLPGGSGASLTRGKSIVGDLGAASAKGYIREVDTATAAELGVAAGEIVNNGTTTAVLVKL